MAAATLIEALAASLDSRGTVQPERCGPAGCCPLDRSRPRCGNRSSITLCRLMPQLLVFGEFEPERPYRAGYLAALHD